MEAFCQAGFCDFLAGVLSARGHLHCSSIAGGFLHLREEYDLGLVCNSMKAFPRHSYMSRYAAQEKFVDNPAGSNLTGPEEPFQYQSFDPDLNTSDDSYIMVSESGEAGPG